MNRPLARFLQVIFVATAASLAYSYISAAKDGEVFTRCSTLCSMHPDYVGSNRRAPEIALRDLDGVTRRLSDLRGKVVVLVFWTSTCSACKQQMPGLAQLQQVLSTSGEAALFTVALDSSPKRAEQALVKATGQRRPFPVVLDPDGTVISDKFGTKLFPETWILDKDGIIKARFDGVRDWSGALAMGVLEQVDTGETCPVSIQGRSARGPGASVCRSMMP